MERNKTKNRITLISLLVGIFIIVLSSVAMAKVEVDFNETLAGGSDVTECTHTYGSYSKTSTKHTRKCTKCNNVESNDHTWGNYKSEGPDDHSMTCSVCQYQGAGPHSGGTATCSGPAVCEYCNASYGSATGHTGGTATCTTRKKCTSCGSYYGSTVDHAVGTDTKYYHIEGTEQHGQKCKMCNEIVVNVVDCTIGNIYTYRTDLGDTPDTTHHTACEICFEAYDAEPHSYNAKSDEHICVYCDTPASDDCKYHAFQPGTGVRCINAKCSATLTFTCESSWVDELPKRENYKMLDAGTDWEKPPQESAIFKTNFPAYSKQDGSEMLKVFMDYSFFHHGDFYFHAGIHNHNKDLATSEITQKSEENMATYTESALWYSEMKDKAWSGMLKDWRDLTGLIQNGEISASNPMATQYQQKYNYSAITYQTYSEQEKIVQQWLAEEPQKTQAALDAVAEIEFAKDNINLEYKDWSQFRSTFSATNEEGLASKTNTANGETTLVYDNFPSGHVIINYFYLGTAADSVPVAFVTYSADGQGRLYVKGGHPSVQPIYSYLTVAYRDVNGEKIPGAPVDDTSTVKTWEGRAINGHFKGTVELDKLDKLGWRYVGYKVERRLGIPSKPQAYNLTSIGETYDIGTSLGDQKFCLVFFFEPIEVTVNHINSDRTTINTNKNCTYSLPKLINQTGHVCTSLGCTHETINEEGRTPGQTAKVHNNTSLNKYLWPGYILTNYQLKTEKGKVLEQKTYDLINNEPVSDATTRTATTEDDTKYGANIPQELYQKVIDIPTNINTGDKVGYKQDLVLDFIYSNVDVKVSHRDYKTSTILKDKGNKDLAYTQTLNGHYFIVSSLITQGEHTLTQSGGVYDITGRIIRKIEITKKNNVIYTKEIEMTQNDEFSTEPLNATNLLYYILSSNDLTDSALMAEINRIGNDIEFKFYYEKVPMLTIKHQDELGNKLWPDEYLPLTNEITPTTSKNLRPWSYIYKEHILDGGTPGEPPAIQLDPNSDVRKVEIPKNGEEDRVLIYIYKQDIPILTVKYKDTEGNEIANPTVYTMEKDSVSTSAKDLSGLKDENGNSFEYRDYILYDGAVESTPQTSTGTDVTVTVPKTGVDRLLVFIYERKGNAGTIDSTQIKSESIILKSNYRQDEAGKDGEEYNVLRAIPTSEDLYANVITDSFLLSNVVSQKNTTQKVYVKLVQPYYTSSDTDNAGTGINITDDKAYAISSANYIEIEMPYSYFSAENVQLNIISKAIVKNESIEVKDIAGNIKESKQVTLLPKYDKTPELQYAQGGKLIFNDLATSKMAGKTVEQYIDGMKSGEYNLKSGFYNVEEKNGSIYVEYVLPEIQYTEVTAKDMKEIAKEYENNPYLLTRAAEQNDARVTMDTLKVLREDNTIVTVLSGAALPINREYTLLQLESMKNTDGTPILDTTPDAPLVNNNVLYKKDEIYIIKDKANLEYTTTADIWYKPHQRVNPETLQVEVVNHNETFTKVYNQYEEGENGEILIEAKKNIPGNSVFVHTPVVNGTYISENIKGIENNKLIAEKNLTDAEKKNTLVLGQEFKITIPHSGTHISEAGYGNKAYNYKGLVSTGDDQVNNNHNAFAMDRQIKFTFGVIYMNKYYPANEWFSLGTTEETFAFVAPEWEKELWKTGKHTIETRVIAENATTSDRLAKTQADKNTSRDNYVATKTLKVNLIGELLDLEIRATNDPSYSNYKTEGTSGMPIGQQGQANAGKAYQYGLKLGYSVYFDITSTGWTGDTTEQVKLTPNYYYVSKNGGEAEKVDLYYKVVGKTGYVSLDGNPRDLTTIMSTDAIRGPRCKSRFASLVGTTGFFNANAGVEMSNTSRLISSLKGANGLNSNYVREAGKNVVNYGTTIKTGTTKQVNLPYTVRLAYANAVNAMLSGKYKEVSGLEVVPEYVKEYCIGHWYGAFKLPATTVAVNPGETPNPDKSNVKKDGYIIVTFEDIHSDIPGGTPYLEVDPDRFAQDGFVNPEKPEFTLPNGKPSSIPEPTRPEDPHPIPAIIYETNIAANQDAEVGGTH